MPKEPESEEVSTVTQKAEGADEGDASARPSTEKADKKDRTGLALKDYAALTLSILSLCVASLGFYFTHLRPGEVKAGIGLNAHLYHPRDGGTAIYSPIHLLNESAAKGIVRKAFLTIENGSSESFALKWSRRAKIDDSGKYQYTGTADPFFVEGKSHSNELFWFWWPPNERVPLVFSPGEYKFTLYVWTNSESAPSNIHRRTLIISDAMARALAENLRTKDPSTWIKPFEYTYTIGVYGKKPFPPDWWKDVKQEDL